MKNSPQKLLIIHNQQFFSLLNILQIISNESVDVYYYNSFKTCFDFCDGGGVLADFFHFNENVVQCQLYMYGH